MTKESWRLCAWLAPITVVVMLGLVAAPLARAADYDVERFVIADRMKDQIQPRISGSWVVWKDYRGASLRAVDDSPNGEIFAYDLSTAQERDIARTKNAGDPAISGTIVVWTEGGGTTTEIRGVDILDGNVFSVTDSNGRQERPAISGPLIAWQDNRSGNWNIWVRDLYDDSDRPLVEQRDDQQRPAVSGRLVVWEDFRDKGAGPNIYGYDLDTARGFRVTENSDASEPAIAGRWVVWVGARDQGVFARNLDENRVVRLSTAAGPKSRPAIAGDLVVWTDERNGNRDIYGYDLVTRKEFLVVQADGEQDYPSIDGATIVWSDGRSANRDIYGGRLSLPRELTASSSPTDAPQPTSTPTSTGGQTAAPSTPQPATASTPAAGERYRVCCADGRNARLRAAPGLNSATLKSLPEGTIVVAVSSETQTADGYTWRRVRDPEGTEGWMASVLLASI